jgi:hypothetical protein
MIICNRGAGLPSGAFLSLKHHEEGGMAGRDIPLPLFMKRKAMSTPMCRISITATRITDLFRVKNPCQRIIPAMPGFYAAAMEGKVFFHPAQTCVQCSQ